MFTDTTKTYTDTIRQCMRVNLSLLSCNPSLKEILQRKHCADIYCANGRGTCERFSLNEHTKTNGIVMKVNQRIPINFHVHPLSLSLRTKSFHKVNKTSTKPTHIYMYNRTTFYSTKMMAIICPNYP